MKIDIVNARKFNEFPQVEAIDKDHDIFLLRSADGTGVKQCTLSELGRAIDFVQNNTGAAQANSYVHEYSLGDHLTPEQSQDIRSGRFELVRVGGYWDINGRKYWAAHADYFFSVGQYDPLGEHHMVVVPDVLMYSTKMNNTPTTDGGYLNSYMKTTGLDKAYQIVETDFGAEHILQYSNFLSNAVGSNGQVLGNAWVTSQKIDLMTEHMVYGSYIWGGGSQNGYDDGISQSQLSLFAARPDLINSREISNPYWLSSVCSKYTFANVHPYGYPNSSDPTAELGVRPAFLIH